jgi:hypothetical protein
MHQVAQATCDLLTESTRVLVVYGKETASIYYEGDEPTSPHDPLPRASLAGAPVLPALVPPWPPAALHGVGAVV